MVETVISIPFIIKINGLKTIPTYQHTAEPLYSARENKSECMECPPKKLAVLERWALVEDQL